MVYTSKTKDNIFHQLLFTQAAILNKWRKVMGKVDTLEPIYKKAGGAVSVNDPLNTATFITALHLACANIPGPTCCNFTP